MDKGLEAAPRALEAVPTHNQTQSLTLQGPTVGVAQAAQYLRGHRKSKLKQTRGGRVLLPKPKSTFLFTVTPLSGGHTILQAWSCSPPCLPGPEATRSHAGLSQDKPGLRCANGATTLSPHIC